jgi:hypothetical protein
MLLLFLRKSKNSLRISYLAGLRAQMPITKLTEKQKHKTKMTQIHNKTKPIKQYNKNVTAIN